MRGSSVLPFAVGLCAGYAVFSIAALHREAATREVVAEAARAAAAAERAASASAAAASAAERHEKAALGASLRALAAAAGPGPAEEEDDARACGVAVPAAMRYWADAEVPAPAGAVPAYDVEAYLTFVPDFGGWNNVRLSLETALVLCGNRPVSVAKRQNSRIRFSLIELSKHTEELASKLSITRTSKSD